MEKCENTGMARTSINLFGEGLNNRSQPHLENHHLIVNQSTAYNVVSLFYNKKSKCKKSLA